MSPVLARQEISLLGLRPGTMLGERFEVSEFLGKGAYGSVYACHDRLLGSSLVALKLLPARFRKSRLNMVMIAREIQASHRVLHDNVIRFYDFFDYGDFLAVGMEYLPSLSLRAKMNAKPIPALSCIVEIMLQCCYGLDAIHQNGVLHRDLKPENILIDENDFVKIADFGVSALLNSKISRSSTAEPGQISPPDSHLIRVDHVVGSLLYLSPETLISGVYSIRTDVYALGIILYEMITGSPPFIYKDKRELFRMKTQGTCPSPLEIKPDCPEPLSQICMSAFSMNPRLRYGNALELAQDLNYFAKSSRISLRECLLAAQVGSHGRARRTNNKCQRASLLKKLYWSFYDLITSLKAFIRFKHVGRENFMRCSAVSQFSKNGLRIWDNLPVKTLAWLILFSVLIVGIPNIRSTSNFLQRTVSSLLSFGKSRNRYITPVQPQKSPIVLTSSTVQ